MPETAETPMPETEAIESAPAQETDWKAEARKWESRAKDNAKLAMTDEQKQQLGEYQTLIEASKSDLERKSEELTRWQGEAERWRTTSVTNRIEALAGQDFADPSDAAAALSDASKYLDSGGVIDETAIKADLAALLEKKPHWRRPEGTPTARTPAPNPAQGTSGNGAAPNKPADAFAAFLRDKL